MQLSSGSRSSPRRSRARRSRVMPSPGEDVVETGDLVQQGAVHVGCEPAWEWAGQARNVGGEQEAPFGPLGPSPEGDVVEQVADGEHAGVHDACRDSLVASETTAPVPGAVPHQELLDVGTFELTQRLHVG